jgi:hypothetical protein
LFTAKERKKRKKKKRYARQIDANFYHPSMFHYCVAKDTRKPVGYHTRVYVSLITLTDLRAVRASKLRLKSRGLIA